MTSKEGVCGAHSAGVGRGQSKVDGLFASNGCSKRMLNFTLEKRALQGSMRQEGFNPHKLLSRAALFGCKSSRFVA